MHLHGSPSEQQKTVADPGFANGGPRSSAEGARIEAPKAPSGRAPQARVSRRRRRRGGWGVGMATFGAFWALFCSLLFIVPLTV